MPSVKDQDSSTDTARLAEAGRGLRIHKGPVVADGTTILWPDAPNPVVTIRSLRSFQRRQGPKLSGRPNLVRTAATERGEPEGASRDFLSDRRRERMRHSARRAGTRVPFGCTIQQETVSSCALRLAYPRASLKPYLSVETSRVSWRRHFPRPQGFLREIEPRSLWRGSRNQ